MIGLEEQRRTPVKRLSGGQQRRLDVAIGLAGNPELLFLDEPTTGLDPTARRGVWDMIKNLRSLDKTVLLTTHYMDEAELLADRVSIIVRGKNAVEGTPAELVQQAGAMTIRFRVDPRLGSLPAGLGAEATDDNGRYMLTTDTPTHGLHQLTSWAVAQGIELEELVVARQSLEDVFVELVRTIEIDQEAE